MYRISQHVLEYTININTIGTINTYDSVHTNTHTHTSTHASANVIQNFQLKCFGYWYQGLAMYKHGV